MITASFLLILENSLNLKQFDFLYLGSQLAAIPDFIAYCIHL